MDLRNLRSRTRSGGAEQRNDSLPPALLAYLAQLDSLAERSTINVFWERQLGGFGSFPADLGRKDLRQRVETFYGFESLPDGVRSPKDDPRYSRTLQLGDRLRQYARHPKRGAVGANKVEFEHMRALDFLRRHELLDDYLAFITPLGIRSSMHTARHYYYAITLDTLIGEHLGDGPFDVLEIGAGAGNLACFLHCLGRVRGYCIIDLPGMLVHSGFTVAEHVPSAHLTFNDPPKGDHEAHGPAFAFVADSRTELIPGASFDLCLNFNSLSEMDEGPRNHYLDLIYRAGRPGALFYNVNRRVRSVPQRDGSTFDNNPLLFPYRRSDRVLLWEEDAFQQETRSAFGYLPSLAVRRAALI